MDNLSERTKPTLSGDEVMHGEGPAPGSGKSGLKPGEFLVIHEMFRSLVASNNLNETMEIIISKIGKLLPCQSCIIFLQDDNNLLPAKSFTPHTELLSLSPLLHLEEPFVKEVAQSHKPFLAPDMKTIKKNPLFKDENCFMCVPLIVKGRCSGVVYVGTTTEGTYNVEHLNTLSILADMAAPSIEAAQLREERESSLTGMKKLNEDLKRLVRQYMALHEIGNSLIIGLKVDEKLYPIGEIMTRIIDYQSLIIFLIDREDQDGDIMARYCRSPYASLFNDVAIKKSDNVLGWVIHQKKNLLLEDTKESRLPNIVENERSVIIIPMMVKDDVVGVFYMGAVNPFQFGDEEIRIVSTVAYQTTMAIWHTMVHGNPGGS